MQTITVTSPRPFWLSERLTALVSGCDVAILPGEQKSFRRRAKMRASTWAERYRVLPPKVSSKPGKWRNSTTPYLTAFMDVAALPFIREIVACKGPQMGVTEAVHNFMGYTIDRAPGPVMYVFPNEDMARENMRDRIEPMINATPQLRKYLTGSSKDAQSLRVDLRHVNVYLAWARSASKLGNKPIRYLSLDEIDKYPETSGKKEASPIALAEARTRTYPRNCKIFKYSTPTDEQGNVWQELQSCPVCLHYEARCPFCGTSQRMVWGQIKWEGAGDANPDTVQAKFMAYYECISCGQHWDDALRDEAVRAGVWRDEHGKSWETAVKQLQPRKVGFHLPSWLSQFVSLSACAAAFLRGHNDKTKLRNFLNNYAAEPWVEYEVERSEDRILALRDDRPRGLVPDEAEILLAGIDTQDNGFWYSITAFKRGQEIESWQVREGFVDSLAALDQVLFVDQYSTSSGKTFIVMAGGIDSQGHRTAEVYDWCRLHPIIKPLKGERSMSTPWKISNLDTYPGTSKRMPGGIQLYRLNVTYYKDLLSGKLEIDPTDPGAWHLHSEYPAEYARHLTAEYRDDRGYWVCPDHKDNHLWDCSVYVLAMADVYGVKFKARTKSKHRQARKAGGNPFTGGRNIFENKRGA